MEHINNTMPALSQSPGNVLPLNRTKAGDVVRVIRLTGGRSFTRRCIELGLRQGTTLKVLSIHTHRPIVVRVHNTKMMLGWGMAHKIIIEKT